MQCECEVPWTDEINTDYMVYHAIVHHFDHTQGFGSIDGLKDHVWKLLSFCTKEDKSAMGQVILRKAMKFHQFLDDFKKKAKLDNVVL